MAETERSNVPEGSSGERDADWHRREYVRRLHLNREHGPVSGRFQSRRIPGDAGWRKRKPVQNNRTKDAGDARPAHVVHKPVKVEPVDHIQRGCRRATRMLLGSMFTNKCTHINKSAAINGWHQMEGSI